MNPANVWLGYSRPKLITAVPSGLIVTETSSGALLHFDVVGYVLVGTTLATLVMMYFISRKIGATATLSSAAA